jgi:hypothetical protein
VDIKAHDVDHFSPQLEICCLANKKYNAVVRLIAPLFVSLCSNMNFRGQAYHDTTMFATL